MFSIRLDPFEMLFLSTPSMFLSVAYQVKNACGFGFSLSLCSLIELGLVFLPQITENTNKWRFFSWRYYCGGENINTWAVTLSWNSEICCDAEILPEVTNYQCN